MTTLMVLGARVMQLPVIWRAREMGLRTVVVDPDPRAPGLALADVRHTTDLANVDDCMGIAQANRVDGVLTFAADYPVRTVAAVTSALDLPGLTRETAAVTTNKRLLRETLTANGMTAPYWNAITSPEMALAEARVIGGESIIKPAMSSGGRGVTQVAATADTATIKQAFDHATHFGDGTVMIEEFVAGPEFSVELVAYRGTTVPVAVTDKRSMGAPHWVEIGHSQPSAQAQADGLALIDTARAAAMAAGMSDCIAHVEIRLSERGPVIIEAAARGAGGYIASHLVPLSTGVDLVAAAVEVALGREPDLSPTHSRGAAVRFFDAPPGVITSISGLDDARRSKGVEHIHLDVEVGDTLQPLQNATHRFGQVICTGVDAAEAISRCDEAASRLRIETVPA
jgi:biotin carboxylase